MTETTSNRYLQALINQNNDIIIEIYERFYPETSRFVLQNRGNEDQAKDIFQESLLYLITLAQQKKLQINNFEAYLFTISKNMWRRELEKQKKWVMNDKMVTLIDKDTDAAMFMIEQKQLELYTEKFGLISDNCKEILSLFFNDVPYEQIIKELSYATINTARQRIFKCRNKLMKLIKSDPRFNS